MLIVQASVVHGNFSGIRKLFCAQSRSKRVFLLLFLHCNLFNIRGTGFAIVKSCRKGSTRPGSAILFYVYIDYLCVVFALRGSFTYSIAVLSDLGSHTQLPMVTLLFYNKLVRPSYSSKIIPSTSFWFRDSFTIDL